MHRKKYDDWSLPKGKTEPGEPLPVTAVREVLEEGGARLALGRRLASVRYSVGGRPKRVHYWAASVLSRGRARGAELRGRRGRPGFPSGRKPCERVSYAHDHARARRLRRAARATPSRSSCCGTPRRCPKLGVEARRRRPAAGRRRPRPTRRRSPPCSRASPRSARLISSAAARCLDTLGPLAELTGAQVRAEQALQVRSSGTDPAASAALIAETIGAGEPAVVCAHRENVSLLQAAAIGALGPPDGTLLPSEWAESCRRQASGCCT